MSVDDPGELLVVLAGGRSRRFGSDKALAASGLGADDQERSEPLALRALRRLAPVTARRALVRAAPIDGLPRDVLQIADPRPGDGPLQALAAAFAAAPARCWYVAPCDLPWLEPDVYDQLAAGLGDAPAGTAVAVARTTARMHDERGGERGLEPLVSLWMPAATTRLARWLRDEPELAVHAALARLGALAVDFDDPRPFMNVNTRAELERAAAAAPELAR